MFAVVPLSDCPHLGSVGDVPSSGIDASSPCLECGSTAENWVCLECYSVHCARGINGHGLVHERATRHPLTLSFSDVSVWCYACEAYIDNPVKLCSHVYLGKPLTLVNHTCFSFFSAYTQLGMPSTLASSMSTYPGLTLTQPRILSELPSLIRPRR